MAKKVGILTIGGSDNYGNVLQNYALQEFLSEQGLQPETISNTTRYGLFNCEKISNRKFNISYIFTYFKNRLNYRYNIKNSCDGIIKTYLYCKKNNDQLSKAKASRRQGFLNFVNCYIKPAKNTIDVNNIWSDTEVDKYDFYISGSDQVWNPIYPSTSSINFLQFAPKEKRIAFAPSFGVNKIPESLRDSYANWLKDIPYLSIREEQGAKIIKELCGRDASVLCDPTMTISRDKWISVEKKPDFDVSHPYLLTYFLGDKNKKYNRFITRISKNYNLKIINLFDVMDMEHYSVSPSEFIYLIRNAKLVCTDSFHGAVFSIIMNTDFIAFSRVESGGSMESRIDTLLKTFGLEERKFQKISDRNIFETDFSNTVSVLSKKKNEAVNFIRKAIDTKMDTVKSVEYKSVFEDKTKCCGCNSCETACPVNCITMVTDFEGFKYPKIDAEKCINCNKCKNVCPVIAEIKARDDEDKQCFVAFSKEKTVRKNSSSGGVFTHLARNVLNSGGVVFGASMCSDFVVRHRFITEISEITTLTGSKYVQSEIGNCYQKAKEFLEQGRKVLFSGTPCQIKGLYGYLGKKEYPNLITQDLICHGVPSPLVWEKYIGYKKQPDTNKISFRDKKSGWHYFSMRISGEKTNYRKRLDQDFFLKLFLDNTILRPICYDCPVKKSGSFADITLADCWQPKKVSTEVVDDDKGLSLVIVNSQKGLNLFKDNDLFSIKVDNDNALNSQSALKSSPSMNVKRTAFFEALNNISFESIYKYWYKNSLIKKIKREIVFCKTKIRQLIVK